MELKLGQRWRTRGGFPAMIEAKNDGRTSRPDLFPFIVRVHPNGTDFPGHTQPAMADGKAFGGRISSPFDLVELVQDVPGCAPPILVPAMETERFGATPSMDALAGIGDVNSTAKGSGARYNTGKIPLDLIPLTILSRSLSIAHGKACECAALYALGKFQAASGKAKNVQINALLDVLKALGVEGWAECAKVFDYGRRKYAAWNWAKGMAWSVPIACAARHLKSMIEGEDVDPESGLPHRGHVFCNIVMLLVYIESFTEGDDRPAAGMLVKVEA